MLLQRPLRDVNNLMRLRQMLFVYYLCLYVYIMYIYISNVVRLLPTKIPFIDTSGTHGLRC